MTAQDRSSRKLVFVYAVDGGLFNAITDYAHKLIAPGTYKCNLCALTYGGLGIKRGWAEYIQKLEQPTEFLHHDEFVKLYPTTTAELPAIFLDDNGQLEILVGRGEISRLSKLDELISIVRNRLTTRASREIPTEATLTPQPI